MSDQYFVAVNGKREGPVPYARLREMAVNGDLRRDCKVWWKGLTTWKPASSIPELFDDLPPDWDEQSKPPGSGSFLASTAPGQPSGSTQPLTEPPAPRQSSETAPPAALLSRTAGVEARDADFNAEPVSSRGNQKQPAEHQAESKYGEFKRFVAVMLTLLVLIICAIVAGPSLFALLGIRLNSETEVQGASQGSREAPSNRETQEQRVSALRSQLFTSIRQGLAGLGIQDGAPFVGKNQQIQEHWSRAVNEAQELKSLVEQLKQVDSNFKFDLLLDWMIQDLKVGIEARNHMEQALAQHAVLTDEETKWAVGFMMKANSLASDIGVPRPFPDYPGR